MLNDTMYDSWKYSWNASLKQYLLLYSLIIFYWACNNDEVWDDIIIFFAQGTSFPRVLEISKV